MLLQKCEERLKIDSESERLKTCGGGLRSPSYRAMENHIQRKGMNKMNQTQTRSPRKRLLSLILAVILMIGLLPISAFATSASAQAGEDKAATQDSEFLRIFHLDCGRKYFTVSEIEGIIDQLAENHYTHIQLAFGNDGLRFLLNDMSLTVNGTEYDSTAVTSAIKRGNTYLTSGSSGELSQGDMDAIIKYANTKGIQIIPLFNAPGHMYTAVNAMDTLGVGGKHIEISNLTDGRTSNWAVNPTDATAVAFAKALLQKYVTYFAGKGSTMFNIGADESGLDKDNYASYAKMVNDMNAIVKAAGMTTLAYNDGIYRAEFASSQPGVKFDNDIVICYWTEENSISVAEFLSKGFKILNNNGDWYYVLGDYLYRAWSSTQWSYQSALSNLQSIPVTKMMGYTGTEQPMGSILCVWCDGPSVGYTTGYGYREKNQTNQQSVYNLIKAMAENNPDYFTGKVKLSASDDATGVSVAVTGAKGQKATVEVKKITSGFTFDTEAHVSYNVTPAVDGKAYTGEGTVTLPVPEGWATEASRIHAYIIDNGAVKLISGTLSGGKYTFQVPHFSEMGLVQLAKGAGSTENVTVAVGRTSKAYDLTGDNLPGNGTYKTDDGIASYTIATSTGEMTATKATSIDSKTKYIIGNGSQYLKLSGSSIRSTANLADATKWTISSSGTGYTIKSGSYYLGYSGSNWQYSPTVSSTRTIWNWSTSDGFSVSTYNYDCYLTYSNGWALSYYPTATNNGQPYTATEVPGGKTVTFKGVAVGNTTAVIGDTQYNITVVNEDLDNAATLPIQLWITNSPIEVTGVTTKGSGEFNDHYNGGYAYYVTAKAEAAFGEKGVALSRLVPDAVKDKSETSRDDRDATYVLWKGTVLNRATGLQKVWSTDMTKANGRVDYQYVRYYNGSWAVSSDRENWTIVTGEGSTGDAKNCKEQVIAYYMQRTNVTQEVITDVVDWGNPTDKWAAERPTQYGVLDFAVKYPDGTRVPDSFPKMGKTVYFHCNENDETGVVFRDVNSNYYRRIGLISGIDTTGYEIYMITVTPTSDTPTEQLTGKNTALTTSTKIEYKGTEKVAWVDDEGNLPSQFKPNDAKFSSISGNYQYTVGGNPNIEGLEIYQRQGMLVTYYIRPVATMDSLHVHYINKNTGNEFYTYPINVKVEFGKEDKAVFNSQIGLDTPWKGPLKNGTVVNDMNVKQTVSADLSTMPAIGAEYRYSTYTCVEVVRSDNGKDVYLYYTFTNSKTFVVDFGLPLEIAPKDMNTELSGKVNKVEVANADRLTYGTVSVKNTPADGYKVVYKLNKTIDGYETINLTYSGVNTETFKEGSVTWTAYIIPASNVYYEDSLATFTDGSGVAQNAVWSTVGNDGNAATEKTGVYQALQELGKGNNRTPYGYDDKYNKENSSMLSMGTAHKVTVTAAMLEAYNGGNKDNFAWPTAQFTFKGTGFDIISLTDNTSGAIMVTVEGVTDTTYKKNFLVNNYYGYAYDKDKNEWVTVASGDSNAIYQIPVMKVNGIPYGEYKVTIGVLYNSLFDKTGNSAYSFWLDAVRIYDPMGEYTGYTQDNEGYPQYIKLHDEVVSNDVTVTNALFIDGEKNATIQQYTNLGPNNEVYLMKGQAITFKLTGDTGKIASVQIGAKAPKGTVELKVNDSVVVEKLSTATEMYYDITTQATGDNNYQVTITNTTGNILSLTNLKITYSEKGSVSLGTLNTQEQESAVSLVRALFTAPVATFSPETFEADWGRAVRAGKRATLTVKTSADVESITVDGQAITSYTTRTQRTGWGWWSPKVTYHVFTYTITAPAQTTDYAVCAVNAEGTASEAVTATLTVKPTTWWNWWF